MTDEQMLQCYNKGCGIKFAASQNGEGTFASKAFLIELTSLIADVCVYHPGAPYFHDAYKIWSCCNKKSTDFSTWLGLKGCVTGPHNPEKPPEPQKVHVSKSLFYTLSLADRVCGERVNCR